MTLSYVAVEATTGAVIADLPDVHFQGPLPQTLMRYESQTCTLPLDGAPANWRQATRPGAVNIIALDEDRVTPVWGGMVMTRRTTHGAGVELTVATPEAYADRRFVGDHAYTETDQNVIVADVVTQHMQSYGLPVRVVVLGGPGAVRTRTYADTEDKTLYSVLGELAGVDGGPQWTMGWENVNNLFTPIFYVGTRVGSAISSGLGANAIFYLPGSVTDAELAESYGSGDGANDVMAYSTGSGGTRPQSSHHQSIPDGRPRFEHRFNPSDSMDSPDDLEAHAARALNSMMDGSKALTLTAAREDAPRLGIDWRIGDDVGFELVSPAWPTGLSGTAQCIGTQVDDNTVVPIVDATTIRGI